MVPQSPQHPVPRDTSVQMVQNFPPSILVDQAHTTMLLTRHQSQHANCATQESTVKDLGGSGPMAFVMRGSTVQEDRGPSVREILAWLTIIMQQALLTAVILHLNVFALHGTRLQVILTNVYVPAQILL